MKEWNSNRRFGMEILEDRALLAVSAGFAQLGFPAETAPTGTAVWVVNTAADSTGWNEMDDVISLREAISCSSAGDTIIFDPGLAGQTITLSGLGLFVVNAVTIDASGIGGITVTAGGRSQVFYIDLEPDDRAVGLIGLTITGGNADDGGGIYNCGALTMTDCTVSGNTSGSRGGAIFSEGVLTLTDCTVSGNTASYSGGGIESHGSLTLSGCVIAGNSANDYWSYDESGSGSESLSTGRGGGIYSEGVLRLTGCTVSENTASEGGGIYSVSATLADCVITGNSAAGYIYSYSEGGSYFYAYGYGGGVYVGGELTAASCVISGNSTGGVRREADSSSIFSSGGGIYNEGILTLTNSVVSENSAVGTYDGEYDFYEGGEGGGICNRGGISLTNCTIAGNESVSGGGVYSDGVSASVCNSVVVLNTSAFSGNDVCHGEDNAVYACNTLSSFTGWWTSGSSNNLTYKSSQPLFTDAAGGDYTLAANSQAIDKGNNAYVETETDLAGNPRIAGGIVDLGAYEYQSGGGQTEQLAAPAISTGSRGVYVSHGANRHRIAWTAVDNASGYELQYSADGSRWTAVSAAGTAAVVTGLTYGQDVQYRVRALGTGSYTDSDWSEVKAFNVCPMDVNGDGDMSGADRNLLAESWLSEEGDDEYRYYADINGDGDVSGADRNFLTSNWLGEAGDGDLTYPKPLAATDAAFAAYASGGLDIDLNIF